MRDSFILGPLMPIISDISLVEGTRKRKQSGQIEDQMK